MKVLVTGGPTRAYLDGLRYLSNHSTGGVAYSLCQNLVESGHKVSLVAGPTEQPWEQIALHRLVEVTTNAEMYQAVMRQCRSDKPDFIVFAAAVLDFAPATALPGKRSSQRSQWQLKLKATPKIIDDVHARYPKIRRVGFKLDWQPGTWVEKKRTALRYLQQKGVDALCLNYYTEIRGKQRHPAYLIGRDGQSARAKTKQDIAKWISDYISMQSVN